MSNYPALVNIAWGVVEQFLNEWSHQPYRWNIEIDAQVAIASRLTAAFDAIGKGSLIGNYRNALPGFEKRQVWSRVSCEPRVNYQYEGKTLYCFPDIVIWGDIPEVDCPPDSEEGGFWPVLWACEIKYKRDKGKAGTWDLEKMRMLVDQERLQYGCWIQMHPEIGSGVRWTKTDGQRLWRCDATVVSPP